MSPLVAYVGTSMPAGVYLRKENSFQERDHKPQWFLESIFDRLYLRFYSAGPRNRRLNIKTRDTETKVENNLRQLKGVE